jgi:nitrite reductase/ring-hydroxylating ferredoxin subunit
MFKLDSGQCVNHPGAAVRTYPTRVNGSDIEIFLPVAK